MNIPKRILQLLNHYRSRRFIPPGVLSQAKTSEGSAQTFGTPGAMPVGLTPCVAVAKARRSN